MKDITKVGQCAYCAEKHPITDLTADHIPPKNLFPKPRASNLISVPCCEACREGWSKDDEYFRAAILSSEKVSESLLSQGAVNSLCRSLGRSKQRGFTKSILTSIEDVEIFTEAGIYLGKKPAFKLETKRIERVAQRIIRGLFFLEKGYSLPEGYEVSARIPQFGLESVLEKLPGVQFPKLHIVQDGVFCYTFKETEEDQDSSIWLLMFYKNLSLVGFIKPNHVKNT